MEFLDSKAYIGRTQDAVFSWMETDEEKVKKVRVRMEESTL
jgi:hypothetical protein